MEDGLLARLDAGRLEVDTSVVCASDEAAVLKDAAETVMSSAAISSEDIWGTMLAYFGATERKYD